MVQMNEMEFQNDLVIPLSSSVEGVHLPKGSLLHSTKS